jgi:hypothetical protein
MPRSRIVWLIGVAVALSLLLVPGASADDVSTQGWATASDLTVADYVQTPYAQRQWGGASASSANLYGLPASGYNTSQAAAMATAIELAGENSGVWADPFLWAGVAAIDVAGTYFAYKTQGLWFHWLSSEWGSAVAGASNGCVAAAADATSNCELWRITAGTQLCIGYTSSTQTAVTWTAPSDGLILVGNTTNLYISAFSGPCYGYSNFNPVAIPSNNSDWAARLAAVNSSASSTFERDSGLSYNRSAGQNFTRRASRTTMSSHTGTSQSRVATSAATRERRPSRKLLTRSASN